MPQNNSQNTGDAEAERRDSQEFPNIGGVRLARVPAIEKEFYEKLLDELRAAESSVS